MMKIPYFDDLNVCYSGYFPRYTSHLEGPSQYWSLELLGEGTIYHRGADGVPRRIVGPAFWVQRPGMPICCGPASGFDWWEHAFLCIEGARAERLITAGFEVATANRVLPLRRYPLVLELFLAIHRQARPAAPALEELLLLIASEAEAPQEGERHRDALEAERLAVIADPGTAHSCEDAAHRIGLSPVRFRQLFSAYAGIPYHRFVLRCRLEAAANALRFTDEPLKAIAAECGLGAPAQFDKSFRQFAGLAPGEFRRRWRQGRG